MGGQFPELVAQRELIVKVIEEEENAFLRTLSTGISLLEGVMSKARSAGSDTIGGSDAFLLYDTYGSRFDLTELIASEGGMRSIRTLSPSNCNATTPLPENRSEHISSILPNYWDRISCQHNGVGCRLRKLG